MRGRFRWARAVVIDAGPKNKMYGLTSKLTVEDRAFIQRHGVEKKNHFQPDFTFTHFQLSWKKLQALRGSKLLKVKKVAERLIKVIERNPSQLLNDETQLCESLGISIRLYPIAIHLWPSERVTFVTEASTKNVESALKWAHLAPPNDRKKRAKVEEWLNTRKIEGLST